MRRTQLFEIWVVKSHLLRRENVLHTDILDTATLRERLFQYDLEKSVAAQMDYVN
jgi:hypothetical protein